MRHDSLMLPLEFRSKPITDHVCFAQDPTPCVQQPEFMGVGASPSTGCGPRFRASTLPRSSSLAPSCGVTPALTQLTVDRWSSASPGVEGPCLSCIPKAKWVLLASSASGSDEWVSVRDRVWPLRWFRSVAESNFVVLEFLKI